MKIAITGGKGGTGKSTIATSLAVELSNYGDVLLVDGDVDCPNDHLILDIELIKAEEVKNMVPLFDHDICTKCGRCSEVCKENAIVQVRNEYPMLVEEQCTGCQSCKFACPVGAISSSKQTIGKIYGTNDEIDLISGEMKPGIEESSLVVNAMKEYIEGLKTEHDYVIFDTAAGTHCPVISALKDVDLGIAVTEPTPLGGHDLELILELMNKLDIESKIVINRSDIAKKERVEKIAEKTEVPIIAEIPYSKEIERNYSEGEPIKHESIERIARDLK